MKAIVFYAPNQADLPKTLKKIKAFPEEMVRRKWDYVKSRIGSGMSLGQKPKHSGSIYLVSEAGYGVEQLLFTDDYRLPKDDNAILQAVGFLLFSLHCMLMQEKMKKEKNWNERKVFFAGLSFGEFWAISMAKELSCSHYSDIGMSNALWDGLCLAYDRGKHMEYASSKEKFAKIVLSPEAMLELENMLNQPFFATKYGRLILKNGYICLFGLAVDIRFLEKHLAKYVIKGLTPSLPFHSKYLFEAGNDFSKNFQNKVLDGNVITDKVGRYLPAIISQGFYQEVDENILLETIRKRMENEGFTENEYELAFI